ncbi:hypothetical protein P9112_012542 [Eukaryota sp. TZLM1-RC]
MYPDLTISNISENPRFKLSVGNRFSKDILQELIRKEGSDRKASIRYTKSEVTRINAVCRSKDCTFRCYATRKKDCPDETPYVVKILIQHTCDPLALGTKAPRPTTSFLASHPRVKDRIKAKPFLTASELKPLLDEIADMKLAERVAAKVRAKAREIVFGTHKTNYARLYSLILRIQQCNPGSHCVLEKEADNTFKRLFIAFGGSLHGSQFCRPLIQIDGTHLKTKHKNVMLCATMIDAQGQLFPIAISIVSGENYDNWRWFLCELKNCLKTEVTTIISDREKGLVESVRSIFPDAFHSYCVRHLAKNIGVKYTSVLWQAARAETEIELKQYLEILREQSIKAYEKVTKAGISNWATVGFEGLRYGHFTSNLIESLNAWLLVARGLPVIAMIQTIMDNLNRWFEDRYHRGSEMQKAIVESVWHKLKDEVVEGRKLKTRTIRRDDNIFVQVEEAQKKYTVNIKERLCTCEKWQRLGIPCRYAVAALEKLKHPVLNGVDSHYLTENYLRTCENFIGAVEIQDLDEVDMLPPTYKKARGRPPTKRLRPGEGRKKKKVKVANDGDVSEVDEEMLYESIINISTIHDVFDESSSSGEDYESETELEEDSDDQWNELTTELM